MKQQMALHMVVSDNHLASGNQTLSATKELKTERIIFEYNTMRLGEIMRWAQTREGYISWRYH